MKNFISVCLSCFAAGALSLAAQENPREVFWENALGILREKPKDGITALDEIADQAAQASAWDEYALALHLRAGARAVIEGRDGSVTLVQELRRAVDNAPSPEARAFLSARLAFAFSQLAQNPRYGQMRPRTAIAGNAGDDEDVAAWSNERLTQAALSTYKNIFDEADSLKKIPVALFSAKKTLNAKILKALGFETREFGIFSLNDSPVADFPTLYDFFAQDAVKFYSKLSRYLPAAQEARHEQLEAWKEFHVNDADKSAYARAVFAGIAPESDDYEDALKQFTKTFSYYPIASEAFAKLAQNAIDDERREEAFLFAKEGYEKYKQYKNSAECAKILDSLLSQDIGSIHAESTWFDAESAQLKFQAKNIEKIYFRAVPWDWQDFLRRERNRPVNLSKAERREILLCDEGAVTWSQELEKFTDFAQHEFVVSAPFEKFEPGFYFITASADPNFKSFSNDRIPYMTVWVSDIAVITEGIKNRQNAKEKRSLRGYVVNAQSGEPLENVEIAAWNKVYGGARTPVESVKTAADGSFELPGLTQGFVALAVAPDGNAVSIDERYEYSYLGRSDKPDSDIGKLFTDRAIYRPGQLIHFKGIRARYNADKPGSEKLLPGEKVEVRLYDTNDREVAKTECYTNAFGSFAGSFTAPAGLLKGAFRIEFDNVRKHISVEEYKRPKFELSLDYADKQVILGQNAEMHVSAKAFTGMPLDGAKISWTVTEQSWENRFRDNGPIARGEAKLDADGNFKIVFPTEPKKLSKQEARHLSPTQQLERERQLERDYIVEIAVTDTSGETITTNRLLSIANCGVHASLRYSDSGCFVVRTTDPSRNALSVPTKLCIYEAVLPEKIERSSVVSSLVGGMSVPIATPRKRGQKLFEKDIVTDSKKAEMQIRIPEGTLPASGAFIAVISGKDAFARPFESEVDFARIGGNDTHYAVKLPLVLSKTANQQQQVELGETFSFIWGSGYESARARIELSKNGKTLKTFWTQKGNTQETVEIPVTQQLAGGFKVRIAQFRDGRMLNKTFHVSVPVKDKKLNVEWQRFRSKLVPGGAEVWTARVTLPNGTPADAEMLALLYDRSLDSLESNWQDIDGFDFTIFDLRNYLPSLFSSNIRAHLYSSEKFPETPYAGKLAYKPISWMFVDNNNAGISERFALKRTMGGGIGSARALAAALAPEAQAVGEDWLADNDTEEGETVAYSAGTVGDNFARVRQEKNKPIAPRKNLQETAFFQPFINTNADGIAQITFVVPETLTGWHFIAFAHDKALRSGSIEADDIVTEKPLMAQPNAPRFLREGDSIEFPVKISNSGKTLLKGKAQLAFMRADDGQNVFAELCDDANEQAFEVPAGATTVVKWKIRVPENCGFLTYRATVRADDFSDGEEALLPILPKKVTVSESANFLVRAGSERHAALDFSDKKIEHLSIDVNVDPAWDAFLALPRLALLARENDSSDSIFYRFYTNKLAEKIVEQNPDYRRKFEALNALGKPSQDLLSPLAQDKAKNIALEATPFVRDANDESAQRRAVAQLFEKNTMAQESEIALESLKKRLQELNGDGWSWFPGAQEVSPRITRTIIKGLARLVAVGALNQSEIEFIRGAVNAQDRWAEAKFNRFDDKGERTPAPLNSDLADWLYMRRLSGMGQPNQAWDHYLAEAADPGVWIKLPRYAQAQIAIVLADSKPEVSERIVESIRQHAVTSDELGMYWKDELSRCPWFVEFASIETQAMMIELFAKVAKDSDAVAELKTWLLTQKQAQCWQTSRASAEAVYALLCTPASDEANKQNAAEMLTDAEMRATAPVSASKAAPQISAGTRIIPADGKRFRDSEIAPELAQLKMKNPGQNPIFVSAFWSYETELDKVNASTPPTGFKIRKSLWKKSPDADGQTRLFPIRAEMLQPGDEIVVRLVIEADRDFEFVHVKDFRASGCEPTGTRSGYRWNNAVWYYATTSDTAEEFFFDRLPQGKHVLEYSLRAVHSGKYSAGFAEIRSLYAPEFSAHSKASVLETR